MFVEGDLVNSIRILEERVNITYREDTWRYRPSIRTNSNAACFSCYFRGILVWIYFIIVLDWDWILRWSLRLLR